MVGLRADRPRGSLFSSHQREQENGQQIRVLAVGPAFLDKHMPRELGKAISESPNFLSAEGRKFV
jgi:hypothetical protein